MRNTSILMSKLFGAIFIILASNTFAWSQDKTFVYGDLLPDAPELAARGEHTVGVQTIELTDKDRIDILNYGSGEDSLYDRPLKIEVWYPANIESETNTLITYDEVMGNANSKDRPVIPFTFLGRADRDAKPKLIGGPYPLVIVSHGYTGSRYLLTYLTENLASKGYVVVAIDHTESTFRDAAGFNSTLLNRSLDVLFTLNEIGRLGEENDSFLHGLVNTDLTALIGYSMGGYGVINVAGAGYSPQAAQFFSRMSKGSNALNVRVAGNPEFEASIDPRIKAVVALAPWGMQRGVWNAEGLAGLKIPSFFVAGSLDDISGYEKGTKAIFEGAINSNRYLLTYINARHNVAPNPPPPESLESGLNIDEYLRYADSVWDMRRINNVNQHFITAFIGIHLKNNSEYAAFLNIGADEQETRTSVGLELKYQAAE
jgi:predicted dienelactone hydrolase